MYFASFCAFNIDAVKFDIGTHTSVAIDLQPIFTHLINILFHKNDN